MGSDNPPNTILNQSLLDAPDSPATRSAISTGLWGNDTPTTPTAGQRLHSADRNPTNPDDTYWTYYHQECTNALHDGGRHVAARTHADIVSCAAKLRRGMAREDVKDALRAELLRARCHANDEELLDNSVDLTASLLLMANFGRYAYGFSGRNRVCWTKGSLGEFLRDYFEPERRLVNEGVKLERVFKASSLDRIAGLEVVWTDNLADHLRLTDDDRKVHLFHHASFLETQRQSADSLLPSGLAEETLRTLALLCPTADAETKQWLAGLPNHGDLDRGVNQCGRLKTDDRRIDNFFFWRDRLVMVKQVFDEAQPKTIRQWWYDSRNGVQWYTFWVAVLVLVLTVVFGLVQSVEGALQVYVSFKALDTGEHLGPGGT